MFLCPFTHSKGTTFCSHRCDASGDICNGKVGRLLAEKETPKTTDASDVLTRLTYLDYNETKFPELVFGLRNKLRKFRAMEIARNAVCSSLTPVPNPQHLTRSKTNGFQFTHPKGTTFCSQRWDRSVDNPRLRSGVPLVGAEGGAGAELPNGLTSILRLWPTMLSMR
jgi:hypothetical protein